jgi:hypothetical protein
MKKRCPFERLSQFFFMRFFFDGLSFDLSFGKRKRECESGCVSSYELCRGGDSSG